MNLTKFSILLLLALTAIARAEPSTDANLAIKADVAKAQQALAQHNISAAVETLDDTVKYLSNADEKTLQALIVFQDRVRETLAATTAHPASSSSPTPPSSGSSPANQAAASDQSLSDSFTDKPAPMPASPLIPKLSPSAASSPVATPGREHKSEPQARAQQPARLALGGEKIDRSRRDQSPPPFAGESRGEGPKPKVVGITREMAASRPRSVSDFPTSPTSPVRTENSLKLLGYYAQDEDGKWVWLPAGSADGPTR